MKLDGFHKFFLRFPGSLRNYASLFPTGGKLVNQFISIRVKKLALNLRSFRPTIETQKIRRRTENGSWSQTQQAEVDLSLPKFDVSSDLDLLDALAQLGMTDVQTPGAADFTPLTTANQLPLALTEAKHAARVKIDEDGCEAAAYTILSVCETAAMPPEEIVEFTLDEPFLFAITGADGLPLFAGIVNQVG